MPDPCDSPVRKAHPRHSFRNRLIAPCILAALGFALVGCGDRSSSSASEHAQASADARAAAHDAASAMDHAVNAVADSNVVGRTDQVLDQAAGATRRAVGDAVDDAKPAVAHAANDVGRSLDRMGDATDRAARHAGADLARAGYNADRSLHRGAERLADDGNHTTDH